MSFQKILPFFLKKNWFRTKKIGFFLHSIFLLILKRRLLYKGRHRRPKKAKNRGEKQIFLQQNFEKFPRAFYLVPDSYSRPQTRESVESMKKWLEYESFEYESRLDPSLVLLAIRKVDCAIVKNICAK